MISDIFTPGRLLAGLKIRQEQPVITRTTSNGVSLSLVVNDGRLVPTWLAATIEITESSDGMSEIYAFLPKSIANEFVRRWAAIKKSRQQRARRLRLALDPASIRENHPNVVLEGVMHRDFALDIMHAIVDHNESLKSKA